MRKKLLIDVTSTILAKGGYLSGIGQSTLWLLNQFSKRNDIPFDVEVYASPGLTNLNFDFYSWPFKKHVIPLPKRYLDVNTRASWACYWRKLFYNYNLYHIPGVIDNTYKGEPIVSTFHDLIAYKRLPDGHRRKELYKEVADRAKGILCISNYVKSDVVNTLNVDPETCSVVYWAYNTDLYHSVPTDEIQKVLRKFGINNPYFFTCSCSDPRKNVVTALRAFKKFLTYNPEHIFVLSWGKPTNEILQEFAKEIEDRKIIFLPYTSDEELVALYNGASMTVYVSREEGFGSPIHESFGCGTPVMTCRNSSLQEVGGDAAIYVGEDAVDDMVDIYMMFEKGQYDINLFATKKTCVLNKFSTDNCINGYIDFYQKHLD